MSNANANTNKRSPAENRADALSSKAWFTVAEAADYVGLGRTTTYQLVRSGTIPSVRFGRVWRIPRVKLDEYLAQQVTAADRGDAVVREAEKTP